MRYREPYTHPQLTLVGAHRAFDWPRYVVGQREAPIREIFQTLKRITARDLALVAVPRAPRRGIVRQVLAGDIAQRLEDPTARLIVEPTIAGKIE